MMCAGELEGKRSPCHKDSGGPLVTKNMIVSYYMRLTLSLTEGNYQFDQFGSIAIGSSPPPFHTNPCQNQYQINNLYVNSLPSNCFVFQFKGFKAEKGKNCCYLKMAHFNIL